MTLMLALSKEVSEVIVLSKHERASKEGSGVMDSDPIVDYEVGGLGFPVVVGRPCLKPTIS